MAEERISQEFRLKNIEETTSDLIEEINRNELTSKKGFHNSKLYWTLSTITGCISISLFASLVGIPIGITSVAIGLKICAITAGIKKHKSIIKKKKKKHYKLALLTKSKSNSTEILISKTLIESVISLDELVLINNAWK